MHILKEMWNILVDKSKTCLPTEFEIDEKVQNLSE